MTSPSILWRAILRSERAMPWANAVTSPDSVSRARRQRWATLGALLPSLSLALIQVFANHAVLKAAWPIWQPILLQLAFVAAGAIVVAAIAFGAAAWRSAAA